MEHNTNQERMREIEIFGIPALFSPNRIATENVYPGLHHYELMSGPTFPDSPRCLTADAGEKFLGTVLSPRRREVSGHSALPSEDPPDDGRPAGDRAGRPVPGH